MIGTPFRDALALTPSGPDHFSAELGSRWAIGGKAHGGLLLAIAARAAQLALTGTASAGAATDPDRPELLAVSADFLRAPDPGAVALHTDVLRRGRAASTVAVRVVQDDRPVLAASVTAGVRPTADPGWADLPQQPAEPPADVPDPADLPEPLPLAMVCALRLDPATPVGVAATARGVPVVRGWARPYGEEPDDAFALLAGDLLPPTVFRLGRIGWAPTVQLTALLRGRPAPGWLRLESRSRWVAGGWFDEDATVVDAAGRLVCQARQLAMVPRPA